MFHPQWRLIGLMLGVTCVFEACGGGGGNTTSASPPPNPLFVSAQRGSNTNLGDRDHPLRTISDAAQLALDNYTIYVGPGTYVEPQGVTTNRTGVVPQGVAFIADTSGSLTADPVGGPVILDVSTGGGAGFNLSSTAGCSNATDISCGMIDGFEIKGAHDAGIVIKSGSNGFKIQNCIVHGGIGVGDGIRVQDSANVIVFNNLVYDNVGEGIGIVGNGSGSRNAQVVSNTVFGNQNYGILLGTSEAASPGAFVHNNILQNNSLSPNVADGNVKVTSSPSARSETGYDADFNLVFDPSVYIEPAGIPHPDDLNQDALFVNQGTADFHLQTRSPAVDAGGPLSNVKTIRVTGLDAQRQSVQVSQILSSRTTTGSGDPDTNARDMGYHYPL